MHGAVIICGALVNNTQGTAVTTRTHVLNQIIVLKKAPGQMTGAFCFNAEIPACAGK